MIPAPKRKATNPLQDAVRAARANRQGNLTAPTPRTVIAMQDITVEINGDPTDVFEAAATTADLYLPLLTAAITEPQ
jgi:hypothetical protein